MQLSYTAVVNIHILYSRKHWRIQLFSLLGGENIDEWPTDIEYSIILRETTLVIDNQFVKFANVLSSQCFLLHMW